VAGRRIHLKRGVRQGDLISPYLFNIAMDFLVTWLKRLNNLNLLQPVFLGCKSCLLYVDDTLLLVKPQIQQLQFLKVILRIFGEMSGLRINMQKSELLITSMREEQVQSLAQVINCKHAMFPFKYLGLPLSDRKLQRQHYRLLVDNIQDRLPGWQASKLSTVGRLILINAVLSAKSIYFMSVFLLPKWVIKEIDKIRRRFLWHGHKEELQDKKPMCLVNWRVVTMSRSFGGLGVRDLSIMNQSLIAKWVWQRVTAAKWWKETIQLSYPSEKPWEMNDVPSFWMDVKKCSHIIQCSIHFQLGNGNMIRF
jgi:Reverse transcriptase (RNA-dependent DNA polymerase)